MKKESNYQPITASDFERMTPGKLFGEAIVTYPNPEDPETNLTSTFTVYDGLAYSKVKVDGVEREVVAKFPLAKFINTTAKSTMKKKIMEVLNITTDRDVNPAEILQTYSKIEFVGD